jgi:hypothetical protein
MFKTENNAQIRVVYYLKSILLLSFIFLVSCQNKRDVDKTESKQVQAKISTQTMKAILADLHQVEASLNMSRGGQPDTTIKGSTQAKAYYLAVYEKHKVTERQFQSALVQLRTSDGLMDATYDSVINMLTAIR